MLDSDLKRLCQKLRPVLGRRADQLWHAFATAESPQSRLEASAFIQMLALKYLHTNINDTAILLPPPSLDAMTGDVFLGKVYYGERPRGLLYLRPENFIKHIGIFSITGGGKTNVAQLLLLGLLNRDIPFLVVDWKRSYHALRSLNHPKVNRLQVYSVGRKTGNGFNWNPLRAPPGVHPKTWISVVAEALEKSHVSGPGVADVFIELFDKKFQEMGVYEGKQPMLPNFFDALSELERTRFSGRRMLWQDSCLRILRTFTFGPAAGAFNARNPVRLEEVLEQAAIIELDQELPKPLRVFLNEILLRWIHLYRLGQGETAHLRHVTFLEEVHNLFPRSQTERQTTNSLENVFREIRGFGEGLVSITQHPSLMPIYALGNCNTQIYLGLQHEDDIFTAKRALFLEDGDEVFLDRLQVGQGIVKIKGRVAPCLVKFPLVQIPRTQEGDT
jgi:hypothetical protein